MKVAEFAADGLSLPFGEHFDAGEMEAYFPGIVAGCTVGEKLMAMPWFIDCGMLFYRSDILEKIGAKVPQTWSDLVAAAKKGAGNDIRHGSFGRARSPKRWSATSSRSSARTAAPFSRRMA